jgi:hypothetical protein
MRLLRLSFVLALALGFGSTFGCSAPLIRIELPGFAKGNVDGVWLWRQLASGYFQRVCKITFSDPYMKNGAELVDYQQTCLDGRPKTPQWSAPVTRAAGNPDTATLSLIIQGSKPPFTNKASAYNAAGESALSTSTVQL